MSGSTGRFRGPGRPMQAAVQPPAPAAQARPQRPGFTPNGMSTGRMKKGGLCKGMGAATKGGKFRK